VIRIATLVTLALAAMNLSGAVQAGWAKGWAKGWSVQGGLNSKAGSLHAVLAARTALMDALAPRDAAGPRR
jgi:hypothetical protein